jgi:signal transduction histidine kinase
MLNTINDIVEISKIDAGIVTVLLNKTDINERIKELACSFQAEAKNKGLNLSIEMLLPPEKKDFLTDQNKLNSILTNLIKNALKYTVSGTIKVGCREKGANMEFYIKDTGVGIPKNRQEAIFERFVQADIADTNVLEGSGLGLAISKSYVDMLGGNIRVESEEGKGSTFYFTLPLADDTKNKADITDEILLIKKEII